MKPRENAATHARKTSSRTSGGSRVTRTAEVGVFGGSGFYTFLEDADEIQVDTPYGGPSAPLVIGELEGRPVAFMPRHGREHELPPHRINYRANVWAMREAGVRRIVAPCACGSLRREIGLGEFVVCDQYVDRTRGRADTFYGGPETTHVAGGEPYCPDLRSLVVRTGRELGLPVRDGGTMIVTQGPRFSTRAESQWFQAAGWDVVSMTGYPEAHLARELELCYVTIAMVTDYDAGAAGEDPVTAAEVLTVFEQNIERLRDLLFAVLPKIGPQPSDVCATALRGARL
jgi:5'-methylthioadenosine phosphorylase